MSQIATTTGFLGGVNGREVLVRAGVVYDDDDPVVLAHPDLFVEAEESDVRPRPSGRGRRG